MRRNQNCAIKLVLLEATVSLILNVCSDLSVKNIKLAKFQVSIDEIKISFDLRMINA